MTDERAREIFTGATKLPELERAAFLDEHCGDDAALRAEVQELLAKDHGSTKVETEKYNRFTGYQVGETVGPFKILAHLGEGGFGAVYLAEQTKPVKRRVALKVIKPGMDSKAVLARFDAEQQALALMGHPGIAKVFDAGATPDGRPYFVMEYVKGEPLNEFCDNQKLNTAQRLELFARVCDAIQHAHQKGVIHRDLKPSNILVAIGEHDEPEPKVIDFGIAKATSQQLTEHTIFTQHGQLIGTPEYMSPEQADMRAVDIDIRTDVYSLGVILYELLSGRLPFDPKTLREKGLAEIQRIIREDDPPKPSTRLSTLEDEEGTKIAKARKTQLDALANTLKKELEWIPLRALKKERRERYGSAEALAQDVRRYLVGEPLEAGPDSRAYRLKKYARRNKGPVITAALVVAALVAGIIGTSIFWAQAVRQAKIAQVQTVLAEANERLAKEESKRADRNAKEATRQRAIAHLKAEEAYKQRAIAEASEKIANEQREIAEARRDKAEDALKTTYLYHFSEANRKFNVEKDVSAARIHLDSCMEALEISDPDEMSFAWRFLFATIDDSLFTLEEEGTTGNPAFSLDGRFMAYPNQGPSKKPLKQIVIRNVPYEGEESTIIAKTVETPVDHLFTTLALNHDGSLLASAQIQGHLAEGKDYSITLWNAATGEKLNTLPGHAGWVSSIAFSPDGTRLASGSNDKTIRIWNVKSGKEIMPALRGHSYFLRRLAFSLDGKRLASISHSTSDGINIWDSSTGKLLDTLRGHGGELLSIAFSPDGAQLASGSGDETIKVWDIGKKGFPKTLNGHKDAVTSVAFSPDGARLVSGSEDKTIKIWHIESGEELASLHGHAGRVNSVIFSPINPNRLVSGGDDQAYKVWDVEEIENHGTLEGHKDRVNAVAFSPDGSLLVSGDYRGTIKLWNLATGRRIGHPLLLIGHHKSVNALAISPDGMRLVSGSSDNTIRVWDLLAGGYTTLLGHEGSVNSVAFNHNGTRLASGSHDNTIRLWDLEAGKELAMLPGHEGPVSSVAFNHNGTRVASGSWDGTVKIWDIKRGQELPLNGHAQSVRSIAFSPDGTRLAAGGSDKTVRIWDAETGEELAVSPEHEGWVKSIAFSHDGTQVVSGSWNGTVRIFDTYRLNELLRLDRHEDGVNSIAFSPDDSRLASGGRDGTIKLNETRNRSQASIDRRAARERETELTPLVRGWISKSIGDNDLVLFELESESQNRSPEEVATLRNLVFQMLREGSNQIKFEEFADATWGDEEKLNMMARKAVEEWDAATFERLSEICLNIARRACALTDDQVGPNLDTLARVHWRRGEFSEAVKWQEKAIEHSGSSASSEMVSEMAKRLSEYHYELANTTPAEPAEAAAP